MKRLFIDGKRTGYNPKQCGETMTVGMLMEALEQGIRWGDLKKSTPIYLCNDGGYTYGEICAWGSFTIGETADDANLYDWQPDVYEELDDEPRPVRDLPENAKYCLKERLWLDENPPEYDSLSAEQKEIIENCKDFDEIPDSLLFDAYEGFSFSPEDFWEEKWIDLE